MRKSLFFLLACLSVYVVGEQVTPFAMGQQDFKPRVVIPNAFPAITDPNIVSVEEADGNLLPAELVIGVVVEGKARAYPINMLTGPRREIINDQLAGTAIAATW